MVQWISGFIDRLLVVLGALVFSQAPQFFAQYMHRLSGHVEELRIHIRSLQQAAQKSGMELPQYIEKFTEHQDFAFSTHGEMMQGMLTRYSEISQASIAMQETTPLTRPFVFLQHFNFDIAKATVAQFQPGVLLTIEGAVYAVIGMGIGYMLYQLFSFPFKKRIVKKI